MSALYYLTSHFAKSNFCKDPYYAHDRETRVRAAKNENKPVKKHAKKLTTNLNSNLDGATLVTPRTVTATSTEPFLAASVVLHTILEA